MKLKILVGHVIFSDNKQRVEKIYYLTHIAIDEDITAVEIPMNNTGFMPMQIV